MKAGTHTYAECATIFGPSEWGLRQACKLTERQRDRAPEARGAAAALTDKEVPEVEVDSGCLQECR
mgnify:CR=1 FL=1